MKPGVWLLLRLGAFWLGFGAVVARGDAQFLLATTGPTVAAIEASLDIEEEDEWVDEYASEMPTIRDPFERVNRTLFKFNNTVFDRVLKPIVRAYEAVVPAPARRGVVSFFDNVRFPVRFAGSAMQGKFGRAGAETGKFLLNSTVGLAGFIKVSDRFPRLQVPAEDFGQTLGVWGLGHGPFLVLPVLGPSSLRDGVGRVGDFYATPLNWRFVDQFEWEERLVLRTADAIAELPDLVRMVDALRQASVDPYIAFRNGYIQHRDAEVKR